MSASRARFGDNWIVREAARVELEKTGFRYLPMEDDLHIKSEWLGPDFARVLSFMLFDDFDLLFTRCTLQCSNRGYLVEREFHLSRSTWVRLVLSSAAIKLPRDNLLDRLCLRLFEDALLPCSATKCLR